MSVSNPTPESTQATRADALQTLALAPRIAGQQPIAPGDARAPMAGWIALAYSIGLVYSSLYPWSGWRGIGVSAFDYLFEPWPRYWTTFDLLTNVLLYAPLGAALAWRLRRRSTQVVTLLTTTAAGAALSMSLEALQTYLPERVASNVDLVSNAAGALAGGVVAVSLWPSRLREQRLRLRPHTWLTLLLLSTWLIVQVLPQRTPLQSGLIIAPLIEATRRSAESPDPSILLQMLEPVSDWLEPLADFLDRQAEYAEPLQATIVALWFAVVGLMISNVLTPSRYRPLAIGALFALAGALHWASARWLFDTAASTWPPSNATQGGVVVGTIGLALLSAMRRRNRLIALLMLLGVALVVTNLAAADRFAPAAQPAVLPPWRNLFGLLEALALLWPFGAWLATFSEWRSSAN